MARTFRAGPVPDRMAFAGGPSVWLEFSPLARITGACNLGQGFPDSAPPPFVTEAAERCIRDPSWQQYARSQGQMNLCQSIARNYGAQLKRKIDPFREVTVTVGATEALFLAFNAFLNKGDEVIMFEPAFDIYRGAAAMCGAVVRSVPLRCKAEYPASSEEWYIDMDELEASFSDKTRLLVINSPHNPTGKVFSRAELEGMANASWHCEYEGPQEWLCAINLTADSKVSHPNPAALAAVLQRHPHCAVLSDEVYEHLVFDENVHIPFATVSDMWSRTLSIYSSGKTFSATGWKIGWVIGPADLIERITVLQQWVVFSVCTPLQEAVAIALDKAHEPFEGFANYYEWLRDSYLRRRDMLVTALREGGLHPVVPQGAFFILADTSGIQGNFGALPPKHRALVEEKQIEIDPRTESTHDYNFARWLTTEHGVTPIPPSAFYCDANKPLAYQYARFAFCKDENLLHEAAARLRQMTGK